MARRVGLCALVILLGLALRMMGPSWGVPWFFVKYGGSSLWGTMVYLLVAIVAGRLTGVGIAGLAMAIAVAVEFSRLYHTPALDAFRLTLAGQLLLGRVFPLWNIVAYAVGIALGFVLDGRRAT